MQHGFYGEFFSQTKEMHSIPESCVDLFQTASIMQHFDGTIEVKSMPHLKYDFI